MPSKTTLAVPGFVYYECLDPNCTEFPRETGIDFVRIRKVGRGCQMIYELDDEQRLDLLEHVRIFGEAMSHGVDDPSVGRRVLRWVDKITAPPSELDYATESTAEAIRKMTTAMRDTVATTGDHKRAICHGATLSALQRLKLVDSEELLTAYGIRVRNELRYEASKKIVARGWETHRDTKPGGWALWVKPGNEPTSHTLAGALRKEGLRF